jgi:purine nucleosidase
MPTRIPILLDTDVGTDVDDAIAIALVLAAPELDLRAVTTVSGDVRLRARIAKKLLTLGGRADVPVAAGVREPVLRRRGFLWLGHEGKAIVADGDRLPLSDTHGVDLLIDTVLRERPHVVTIGPLSNLAVAIMKEPAVIGAIPHLTVMGGSLGRTPGVAVPPVEYNLGSDAEAALVVLDAGIPTTLVPLDVTFRTFFLSPELARLRASRSRLVQTVCDAIEVWAPVHRALFEGSRTYDPDTVAFLHDPLTVAVLFDPTLVTIERLRLRPAIVDGAFRLLDDATAGQLDVAVGVDAPRFVELLLERLLRLP